MNAVLPPGRRHRCITLLQIEQLNAILGAHSRPVIERHREFRIETDVGPGCTVVEFCEVEQRYIRERIFREQRLTPPPVRYDHVRLVSLRPQRKQYSEHGLPMQNPRLERLRVRVRLGRRYPMQRVRYGPHAASFGHPALPMARMS